jgi:hypothetical protein
VGPLEWLVILGGFNRGGRKSTTQTGLAQATRAPDSVAQAEFPLIPTRRTI